MRGNGKAMQLICGPASHYFVKPERNREGCERVERALCGQRESRASSRFPFQELGFFPGKAAGNRGMHGAALSAAGRCEDGIRDIALLASAMACLLFGC